MQLPVLAVLQLVVQLLAEQLLVAAAAEPGLQQLAVLVVEQPAALLAEPRPVGPVAEQLVGQLAGLLQPAVLAAVLVAPEQPAAVLVAEQQLLVLAAEL